MSSDEHRHREAEPPNALARREAVLLTLGELLGVRAIAGIEQQPRVVVGRHTSRQANRAIADATRSTSSSVIVPAKGSASARSNAASAPGKAPRSR